MQDKLSTQRTYALVGHGGSGKTSVAEMLLFNTSVTNRLGKIDEGTTCLDYEPEEVKRRGGIQPGFGAYRRIAGLKLTEPRKIVRLPADGDSALRQDGPGRLHIAAPVRETAGKQE